MDSLAATSPTATIPLDIFGVIAEWLVAQNLHGTCASLNLASRHVQDETRPVLWRRVVYRFNNGPSNKKKAGTRWRITFGSVGAQYMQSVMSLATDACVYHFRIHRYLTVVPSILPEFGNDVAPWEPPFLGLITSRRNKMKACLIPGKMSTVSVTLFSGYEPGTSHLGQVMSCAGLLRRMTDGHASVALIRLYKQTRTLRGEVDNRELEDAFNRHHHNIETSTVGHVPFSDIRLLLTRHETLSNDFMARLSVDVISWLSLGVYACCDERLGHDQQWELAGLMRLMVYVSHFDQAVAFGRALGTAYRVDARFACFWTRVSTRAPFTEGQARRFLNTVERDLLITSPTFLDKRPGGVLLCDSSKESEKKIRPEGLVPPFASIGYIVLKDPPGPEVHAIRRVAVRIGSPPMVERAYLDGNGEEFSGEASGLVEIFETLSLFS